MIAEVAMKFWGLTSILPLELLNTWGLSVSPEFLRVLCNLSELQLALIKASSKKSVCAA